MPKNTNFFSENIATQVMNLIEQKDQLEQKKRDSEALNTAIKKLIQEEIKRQQELAIVDAKKKEEARKKKNELGRVGVTTGYHVLPRAPNASVVI